MHRSTRRVQRVSVIFVQYDRHRYGGALERLVSLLEGLETADYRIAVVDNGDEGDWFHQVSRRLLHLGGDNASWEFSAFDKGLERLEEQEVATDIYVFVTDAFLAYGEEVLELVDDHALQQCRDLMACVGWTDSFLQPCSLLGYDYDCWLRTSFLLVPAEIVEQIRPLSHPLDPQLFFGPGAVAPFLPTAPVDETLQARILGWLTTHPDGAPGDESWHSRFELDDDTFERFQNKTLAIFREHLLSAKLQASGIPCYDLRLLQQLATDGGKRRRFRDRKVEWQWLGWRDDPELREPQFHLDECRIPRVVEHGDDAAILVVGWALSEPPVREVCLELSDGQVFAAICDQPREDVHQRFPEFDQKICGFELRPSPRLPVGEYGLRLKIPAAGIDVELGTLEVQPKLAFEPLRQFFSTSVAPGFRLPICLEGEVESTDELRAVRAMVDGEPEPPDVSIELRPSRRPQSGLHRTSVSLFGRLEASKERRHVLELHFETQTGQTHCWCHTFLVEQRDTIPHALIKREVGSYDPSSATTHVDLEGGYWGAESDDRLVLLRDGGRVSTIVPDLFPASEDRETLAASFRFAAAVGGLLPGPAKLDLALERGEQLLPLNSWKDFVTQFAPSIHVEELEVHPDPAAAGTYTLLVAGHIVNTFVVDGLSLYLDHQICAIAGVDQLQPSLQRLPGHGTVILQGFRIETAVRVEAGEHQLRIAVTQSWGQPAEWRRNVHFDTHGSAEFRIYSADLAALISGRDRHDLAPIEIEATVASELSAIVANLHGDGELVDQCRVESGHRFGLRWIPPSPGRHRVRVEIRSQGRSLYDSGEQIVEIRAVEASREMQELVMTASVALGLDSPLHIDLQELTLRLIKKEMPRLHEFLDILRRLSRRLRDREAEPVAAPQSLDLERLPPNPLRILFVAWEVPCLRHGGGVCMLNLLKGLSKRHQITLIHSYGVDERNWIDDARPFVDRLISVPRDYQETKYVIDPEIPDLYRHNYTPGLRSAVQRELLINDYDLVNYEYSTIFPHIVSTTSVPSVLTILEMPTAAKRTVYFKGSSIDTHVDQLRDFLKSANFYAEEVPKVVDQLILLTESDAEALLELRPNADVYINKIGVGCDSLARPEDREPKTDEPPTLVFLGNFRHSPNQQAVEDFATRVMPRVLERYPEARFRVVGGFAPAHLQTLNGTNNTEILGFVDDFRPYLWDATAFVAPLTSGAGMRVKVLEALACGAPVIATALAMEGMEATDGRHYLEAETDDDWAEACCRLIRDRKEREDLGKRGRALVRSKHDWRNRVQEREAIWQRVIEGRKPSGERVPTKVAAEVEG